MLTKKNAEILRDEIRCHAYLYYVLDDPWVPDAVYDTLWKMLKRYEAARGATPDTPTGRVGADIARGFINPGTTKEWILDILRRLHDQKTGREKRSGKTILPSG